VVSFPPISFSTALSAEVTSSSSVLRVRVPMLGSMATCRSSF
jgi:hypothetical protein